MLETDLILRYLMQLKDEHLMILQANTPTFLGTMVAQIVWGQALLYHHLGQIENLSFLIFGT